MRNPGVLAALLGLYVLGCKGSDEEGAPGGGKDGAADGAGAGEAGATVDAPSAETGSADGAADAPGAETALADASLDGGAEAGGDAGAGPGIMKLKAGGTDFTINQITTGYSSNPTLHQFTIVGTNTTTPGVTFVRVVVGVPLGTTSNPNLTCANKPTGLMDLTLQDARGTFRVGSDSGCAGNFTSIPSGDSGRLVGTFSGKVTLSGTTTTLDLTEGVIDVAFTPPPPPPPPPMQ